MATKPDGRSAGVDRVSFTRPAAERIGKVVRQVEGGSRDLSPIEWGPRGVGGSSGKVFRVGTFTGAWAVDTANVVTFRNVTSTPNTVHATNLLISLPSGAETSSSRICNIAKDGTAWYLVSFRAVSATAVFARQTQTITFFGTGSTQAITYATPGSPVAVLTDVAASLNTTSCAITVTKTTASVQIVGTTQTAAVISTAAMQTAAVMSQTYTATYISLEL
jgi:hypothetical protein